MPPVNRPVLIVNEFRLGVRQGNWRFFGHGGRNERLAVCCKRFHSFYETGSEQEVYNALLRLRSFGLRCKRLSIVNMDSGSTQEKAVPTALDSKRKRGRPRKSEQQPEEGSNGDIPLKARKAKKNVEGPALVDATLVGQHVQGVLDGCFDAGYILTVRVGDSDTILRGVVFGPGLSVPVTDATDIAPSVKFAKRDEHTSLPKTPPSKSQTATPAAGNFTMTPQQHRLMIQGYTPTQQPAGT